MAAPALSLSSTFAEYLAIDEASDLKHEYVNERIFALGQRTLKRCELAANVIGALGAQLQGRRYTIFTSSARVRVLATGLATYPDVSVVCGAIERDPANKNTLINPVVLVEVLSDSTEGYDREEKFSHYRRIPSLREYLLVSQHEQRIEHLSRNQDGTWTLRDVVLPGVVDLPSIGCTLTLDQVYTHPLP